MQQVNCDLCGRTNSIPLFTKGSFTIVRCINCGLIYINPRLDDASIKELYNNEYYAGKGFDSAVHYTQQHQQMPGEVKRSLQRRLICIEKYKSKGRLLDIGCGLGDFLSIAKQKGWDCSGLELSEYAAQICRESLGINITTDPLENANLPEGYFDVITLFETIEHLTSPISTLRKANKLLKDNGLLVIQTSNSESLPARSGSKWGYFLPSGHLYYFSKKTMLKLLNRSGFTLMKYDYAPDSLNALYHISRISRFQNSLMTKRKALDLLEASVFIPFLRVSSGLNLIGGFTTYGIKKGEIPMESEHK